MSSALAVKSLGNPEKCLGIGSTGPNGQVSRPDALRSWIEHHRERLGIYIIRNEPGAGNGEGSDPGVWNRLWLA